MTAFVHRYCHRSWSLRINYVTQLSAFQPLHQLKASQGGFLHFKERTFLNSVMTSNNPKVDWCNYGHNVTLNFDYILTWFNGYFTAHKKFRSSFCLARHLLGLDPSVMLACLEMDILYMWLLPMGVASPRLDREMHPRSSFSSWLYIFRVSREAC